MTDTNYQTAEEASENCSAPWENWREMIRGAFVKGKDAGTEAGQGFTGKLPEVLEKAVYDATYGIAYSVAYAATMAKDVVSPASSGVEEGMRAGTEAAEKAKAEADAASPGSPSMS